MKKSEKARKKDFSRRAAHLFFGISALCPALRTLFPPLCPADLSRRSVPPCRALCPADLTADRVHQYHVKKITYERLFIYPTSGVKIGVLTPQKIGLLKKSTFPVYYKNSVSELFNRANASFLSNGGYFTLFQIFYQFLAG